MPDPAEYEAERRRVQMGERLEDVLAEVSQKHPGKTHAPISDKQREAMDYFRRKLAESALPPGQVALPSAVVADVRALCEQAIITPASAAPSARLAAAPSLRAGDPCRWSAREAIASTSAPVTMTRHTPGCCGPASGCATTDIRAGLPSMTGSRATSSPRSPRRRRLEVRRERLQRPEGRRQRPRAPHREAVY